MKLDHQQGDDIQPQQNIASKKFESSEIGMSAAGSAMAAYILRDKIYSDKPLAVVREYLANALDEHVKVKAADAAFIKKVFVSLPLKTDASPFFAVRDFAYGLDDDGVRNVFGMYFESTKQNTNTQIGGFGVGSKAGHAYTETFYVTSWHDGRKKVYSFVVEGNSTKGKGSILLLSDTVSSDPSGIEVKVPVKPEDIYKFENSFAEFAPFINKLVETNIDDTPAKLNILAKRFGSVEEVTRYSIKLSRYTENRVVCGFIPYSVGDIFMKECVEESLKEIGAKHGIPVGFLRKVCLFGNRGSQFIPRVNIGDVDISVSRENLETTHKTKESIKTSVKMSLDGEVKKFKASLAKVKDVKGYLAILKEYPDFASNIVSYFENLNDGSFANKFAKGLQTFYALAPKLVSRISVSRSTHSLGKTNFDSTNLEPTTLMRVMKDHEGNFSKDSRIKYTYDEIKNNKMGKVAFDNRVRSAYAEAMEDKDNNSMFVVIPAATAAVFEAAIKDLHDVLGLTLFEEYTKKLEDHKPTSIPVFCKTFLKLELSLDIQKGIYLINADRTLTQIAPSMFPKNGVITYTDGFSKIYSSPSDEPTMTSADMMPSLKCMDGGGQYKRTSNLLDITDKLGIDEIYVMRRGSFPKVKRFNPVYLDSAIDTNLKKEKTNLQKEIGLHIANRVKSGFFDERLVNLGEFQLKIGKMGITMKNWLNTNLGSSNSTFSEKPFDYVSDKCHVHLMKNDDSVAKFAEKTLNDAIAKAKIKGNALVAKVKAEILGDKRMAAEFKLFIIQKMTSGYNSNPSKLDGAVRKELDKISK